MELNMKKEKHSGDKISEQTLHEILLDIKYRLNHIEDITADDRAVLVKLVKQTNQIVKFLSNIDIETYEDDYYEDMSFPSIPTNNSKSTNIDKKVSKLIDDFMNKRDSLKELEKELKKHKDMLTPGQIGEA
tara:strand:- start:43 stop:435 length:393 start_codon:yes stop_codon:yes gene_type:complete